MGNFGKFPRKKLVLDSFLIKLSPPFRPAFFLKKRLQHRHFNVKFAEVLRKPILKNMRTATFIPWELILLILSFFLVILDEVRRKSKYFRASC